MTQSQIHEVLPKAGLVYSEKSSLSEILSKPKVLPLKSITLERIDEMEARARKIFEETRRPSESQSGRPLTASSTSSGSVGRPSTSGGRPASSARRSSCDTPLDNPRYAGTPSGGQRPASSAGRLG